MKTLILVFLCFATVHFTQAQTSSIKLNQTFSSRDISSINIDIHNPNLIVKTIKGSIIVVETSVEISSTNFRLLEFIADNGRYDLVGEIDEATKVLNIKDPKKKDEIKIKGKTIKETVVYTVYIPENKKVQGVDVVAGR